MCPVQLASTTEIPWQEALPSIRAYCPELADIIQAWDPGDEYTIIRVRYPYGAIIFEDGIFYLPSPDDGRMLSLEQAAKRYDMCRKIAYSPVPLGIISKNCFELYYEADSQLSSLRILEGPAFGLWETFNAETAFQIKRMWTVSSGARSVFPLAKTSDNANFKQLAKKYGLRGSPPKRLLDHWDVYKKLSASTAFDSPWYSQIDFFPSIWLEKPLDNIYRYAFRDYLWQTAWLHADFARNQGSYDVIWKFYADCLANQGLKPELYWLNTIRHLMFSATGDLPSFAPTDDSDKYGPFTRIRDILMHDYKLKYAPTIMTASHFDLSNPVYYSLQLPMVMSTIPRLNAVYPGSILEEARLLEDYLSVFISEGLRGKLKLEGTPLGPILEQVSFDLFHNHNKEQQEIRPSHELPIYDERLTRMQDGSSGKFPENSPFLRGCLKISKQT